MSASTIRLKAIAALRAVTIAISIQASDRPSGKGCGRTARSTLISAKGRAKIVCSNFIISRIRRVLAQMAVMLLLRVLPLRRQLLIDAQLLQDSPDHVVYQIVDRTRHVVE